MNLRRSTMWTALGVVVLMSVSASALAQDAAPYQPTWHLVRKTPNADAGIGLFSVTAPAKDDAWAVGTIGRKHATGYILHWDGQHWRPVTLPSRGFQPWFVDSSSPDDVWFFGPDSNGDDEAFYRSAAGWQSVPQPPLSPPDQYPTGGLVVNAADVWLPSYPALHWNGQHWKTVHLPRSFELMNFADAGGTIWAVGLDRLGKYGVGRVAVYRLRHGQWHWMAMPRPHGFYASVVADGPHSVFVTVTQPGQGITDTTALHWNGRSWRTLPKPPAEVYFLPVASFGSDGLWLGTSMLWNGSQWVDVNTDVDSQSQLLVTDYGGIAQIPGTRSSWLVMPSCTGPEKGCHGQIWVAGRLP
jgi:hypothetical protein